MPTSKDIDSYPLHLYKIVEEVLTTRKPIQVPMNSKSDAYKLRFQVYGLRGALRAMQDHPLQSEAAKISTRLNGNVLTICHIDESADPALIKAAGGL